MKEGDTFLQRLKHGADIAVETAMGRTFGRFDKIADGYLLMYETYGRRHDGGAAIIRLGSIRGIEFHDEDLKSERKPRKLSSL